MSKKINIMISLSNGLSYFLPEMSKGTIGKNGYLYITYLKERIPDIPYADSEYKRKQFKIEKIKEMRFI